MVCTLTALTGRYTARVTCTKLLPARCMFCAHHTPVYSVIFQAVISVFITLASVCIGTPRFLSLIRRYFDVQCLRIVFTPEKSLLGRKPDYGK